MSNNASETVATVTRDNKIIEALKDRTHLAFLGLSSVRVMFYLFLLQLSSGVLIDVPALNMKIGISAPLFFATSALVALVLAASARRHSPAVPKGILVFVAVVGLISAILFAFYKTHEGAGVQMGIGDGTKLGFAFFGGLMYGSVMVYWGVLYSTLKGRKVEYWTVSSFIVSFLCILALKQFPTPALEALQFLMPIIATSTLWLAARTLRPRQGTQLQTSGIPEPTSWQAAATEKTPSSFWRLVIGVFIVVCATCIIRSLIFGTTPSAWVASVNSTVAEGCVIAILIISYLLFKRLDSMKVYSLTLPLIVAGYAGIPLLSASFRIAGLTIIDVGYGLFELMAWILVVRIVQRNRSSLRLFGFLVGATTLGFAIGRMCGQILRAQYTSGLLTFEIISLAMIIVLVIAVILVLPEWLHAYRSHGEGPEDGPATNTVTHAVLSSEPLDATCAQLAVSMHLTARETEVLFLLVKGRNLSIIARELQIAKGTAHTHIKRIYQKAAVHSQQELIDLVEKQTCSMPATP